MIGVLSGPTFLTDSEQIAKMPYPETKGTALELIPPTFDLKSFSLTIHISNSQLKLNVAFTCQTGPSEEEQLLLIHVECCFLL